MNKYLFIIVLFAALVFLPGASVWEGAAAVSMDFPESGLYVATNSFPRNTVVELTNLETGKTVRVIVTAGLDTPGLLALVSREAADVIGLRSRTIGRIRMIAMQDPIAFSRFSEEYRSGDPDYDPLAAVEGVYGKEAMSPASPPPTDTDQALRNGQGSYWDDTVTVMQVPEQIKEELAVTETPVDIIETIQEEPVIVESPPEVIIEEPVIVEAPPEVIVEEPVIVEAPPEIIIEEPVIVEAPPEVIVEEPVIVEAPPEIIVEEPVIVEAPPEVIVEDPVIVETPPEIIIEDPVIVEAPPEIIVEEPVIVEAPPEVIIEEPVIVETPPEEDFPETVDAIAMIVSTRDPMVTDLPVDTTPAPVVIAEPEPAYTPPPAESVYTPPPAEPVYTPPPAEPVYTPPPAEPAYTPPPAISEPVPSPEYTYSLIPAEERPPHSIPAETPPAAYVPPGTSTPQIFSVPSVLELESGKYYLQIGAYSHTPTVEQELAKIEHGYPVMVQCITVSGSSMYRVLIGPVNQGEAGALLKKFQGRGYKDAFVRRG